MAVEEGTREGSICSMFLASRDSKDTEDILSSEELAWVDSCLTTDLNILDSGWSSLKDAMMEVITFQSQQLQNASAAEYDIQMLPSTDEDSETRHFAERTGGHLFQLTEEEADAETYSQVDDISQAATLVKNVFLPNYKEFPEELVDVHSTLFTIEAAEMVSLSKDIFKVWEFDIHEEEGEFDKQLNKALSNGKTSSAEVEGSVIWRSAEEDSDLLDELVTGITDLSL